MFKALTVEREFGAGGSIIARQAAETLGWNLLDSALIVAVAREAQVDRETAMRYDERVDSWWHRFHRRGLWGLAVEGGMAPSDVWFPDAESMAVSAGQAIAKAAAIGKCVIVGRGAQCVLQDRGDVFHVFIYGPGRERVSRVRHRIEPSENAGESIRLTDGERARYIRTYYGCDWKDPHLYHMMISSEIGVDNAARTIVDAVQQSKHGFYTASRRALPA
jgi:Cytidylate kinase-like family